ncbi:Arf-GAP with GTPase, ANK repeat and PH domain-containing 9 [Gossypium arboreum]|uniref:Arf-GAP with GTPase, ANK repeat and PH domain-containing 9 n=1 Tax=Gossypium arboreum TaxID=29729 RepID=A0A0B0NGG3_GOSAR|nr:Arf-GAP with GTPase, ANK repeat and PH domain-containing 9 [Gossypium arboreum]
MEFTLVICFDYRFDSSLDSDKVGVTHHIIQLPIGTFELVDICKYDMYRLV